MKNQILDIANLFSLSDFVSMMEHSMSEDLYSLTGNESEMRTRYLVATLVF